jgi:quaternary ammonium compound-resistance protein SugE
MTAWTLLFLSGLLEVVFTTLLKLSQGLRRPLPTLGFMVVAPTSLWLLSRVLEEIPIGTAYAIWTGIGAVGTAVVGLRFFGESASAARLAWLGLLVASLIGLRLVS